MLSPVPDAAPEAGPEAAPVAAPLVFFGVNYLFVLLFVRLNWPRYYLPSAVAAKLLIAVGIITVFSQLAAVIRRTARPAPR